MASITTKLLKTRVSKPTFGKWSSGFTACKKYADDNKVPLIAVWSNGDACGHCTTFETAVMNSTFTKWMASSKCIFWFGCSSDKTKDDKMNGTGYDWAWKNQSLKTYPFVRVWWKAGKVDKAESGDYWIDSSSKGYNAFIKKLNNLLKNYKPDAASTTTPTEPATPPANESTDNGCDNGDCNADCNGGCSPEYEQKVAELVAKTKEVESSINALSVELDALKAAAKAILCELTNDPSCKA